MTTKLFLVTHSCRSRPTCVWSRIRPLESTVAKLTKITEFCLVPRIEPSCNILILTLRWEAAKVKQWSSNLSLVDISSVWWLSNTTRQLGVRVDAAAECLANSIVSSTPSKIYNTTMIYKHPIKLYSECSTSETLVQKLETANERSINNDCHQFIIRSFCIDQKFAISTEKEMAQKFRTRCILS